MMTYGQNAPNPFAQTVVQPYNTEAAQVPQPTTDMQTYVQRTQEVSKRLAQIHDSLAGLIGRLYGEGVLPNADGKNGPRAAGLSSEMDVAISDIEAAADRLFTAASRLSSFA